MHAFMLRPLGTTGLEVSPLCIGCSALGNMPETFGYTVVEEQALATIRAILDDPWPVSVDDTRGAG